MDRGSTSLSVDIGTATGDTVTGIGDESPGTCIGPLDRRGRGR